MTTRIAPPLAADGNRSFGFLLLYAIANAGGVIGFLPLLTLLLPMKIEAGHGIGSNSIMRRSGPRPPAEAAMTTMTFMVHSGPNICR